MYDFLIIGGGVFGVSTAIELAKRKYKVALINPDTIPHHLAASTDVTKAVRMEYGSDEQYFKMAEICIERWKEWNDFFKIKLYHEVGFLMLCQDSVESEAQKFENSSLQNLLTHGYQPERLKASEIQKRFPAINTAVYPEAIFNPVGGYVESGLAIEVMADYARSLGVDVHEGQTAQSLIIKNNQLQAVTTFEGQTFHCGHAIIAAGSGTPYLLPELQAYMKITGHPVFWLKPENPEKFTAKNLPVFTADISNTGWYGFPFITKKRNCKSCESHEWSHPQPK